MRVEDDVTLALRGERIPLRNAVSSAYNRPRQELLVATPAALFLYGKMLTAGGDLLATLSAEENAYFQFVVYLPWVSSSLQAYSVDHSSALTRSLTAEAGRVLRHRLPRKRESRPPHCQARKRDVALY